MLLLLDARGKKNWVSNIRCKLYMFGFGYVWLNDDVEETAVFLRTFKERPIECRWEDWEFHVHNSERFRVYITFSSLPDVKTDLLLNIDKHLKYIMAKFRHGISEISEHCYRYIQHRESDLICKLCKKEKENKVHFVLHCCVLQDLRVQYILSSKFLRFPSMYKINCLC